MNYVLIDWKSIGSHNSRLPVEADLIFIPNFNEEDGKKLIRSNKEKFISLMLIFGQINLLQVLMKRLQINNEEIEQLEDYYFN